MQESPYPVKRRRIEPSTAELARTLLDNYHEPRPSGDDASLDNPPRIGLASYSTDELLPTPAAHAGNTSTWPPALGNIKTNADGTVNPTHPNFELNQPPAVHDARWIGKHQTDLGVWELRGVEPCVMNREERVFWDGM